MANGDPYDLIGYDFQSVVDEPVVRVETGGNIAAVSDRVVGIGGGALRITRTSAAACYIRRYTNSTPAYPSGKTTGCAIDYIRFTDLPANVNCPVGGLALFSGNDLGIYVSSAGALTAKFDGGTMSGTIATLTEGGAWARIEVRWDTTTTTHRAWVSVDGGTEVEVTRSGTAGTQIDGWWWGANVSTDNNFAIEVDDHVHVEGNARPNVEWKVRYAVPNEDIDSNWTIVGSAPDRANAIDVPNYPTDYIKSTTSGQVQRVLMSGSGALTGTETIKAVQFTGVVGSTGTTGTRTVTVVAQDASGNDAGATAVWSASINGWRVNSVSTIYLTNPTGGAWTAANTATLRAKMTKSATADEVRVAILMGMIAVSGSPAVDQVVALPQATSSSTAQAIGRKKVKAIAQATETDSGRPITNANTLLAELEVISDDVVSIEGQLSPIEIEMEALADSAVSISALLSDPTRVPFARRGGRSRRPELIIRLTGADETETVLGTGYARGIMAEGFTASADDRGPVSCGFNLKRDPTVPSGDLAAFSEADVEIGNTLQWSGRVWETPGSADSIAVSGKGWQSHLEDDVAPFLYVMGDATRYVDQRSLPSADFASTPAGQPVVSVGGVITLLWPYNSGVATGNMIAATLDLGETRAIRVVLTWERIGASESGNTLYSRGSDFEIANAAGDDSSAVNTATGGTIAHTFTSPRRYHHIFLYRNGANGTWGQDQGVKITKVQLFGSTVYESGNASILTAADVVLDIATSGICPKLSSSVERIEASGLIDRGVRGIPHLAPVGYVSPRSVLDAVNAYHGWIGPGVDASRRLFFEAPPAAPIFEVGPWSGGEFQDQSAGSAETVYNRVIVQGSDGVGGSVTVIRYNLDTLTPSEMEEVSGAFSNPGFETNVSGWTVGAGALARVTGSDGGGNVYDEGSAAAKMTGSTSGVCAVAAPMSGLTVGSRYQVRLRFRTVGSTNVLRLIVADVLDSANLVIGSASSTEGTAAYQTVQVSFVATATAHTLRLTAEATAAAASDIVFIDSFHIYRASSRMVLDRQGITRTMVLQVSSIITPATGAVIADIWLRDHAKAQFKGSYKVAGMGGIREIATGRLVHPSELLGYGGQRIRFAHLIDPDTGGLGRDGIMSLIQYEHEGEAVSISIDNERGRLDALLARVGALQAPAG